MSCQSCGSPATGGLCRDCELAERFEAEEPATFDADPDGGVEVDG